MLLSLIPTSKAKVSGICIANKIETKQLQCTRVQTAAKDSEGRTSGSAVSFPSGVWGGAPAACEFYAFSQWIYGLWWREQSNKTLKLCFLSNAFHSQNAEVRTTILTQMLLSLLPTSKAKVSGIGIANKIGTKQLQCTRVQTTAKDSEGPLGIASSPSGVWGGAQPRSNLVNFSLKIWHLMATVLMILLRIDSSNFVQSKQ